MWLLKNVFSIVCFIEALYEKKQAILTFEMEIAKLQAQVKSSEECETTVKENEGNIIKCYVNYQHIASISSVLQFQSGYDTFQFLWSRHSN